MQDDSSRAASAVSVPPVEPDATRNRSPALRAAVRGAIAAGALAALGAIPSVLAQGADGGSIEEVVVTGSRVRRVDAETASPVYVIDAAMVQESGVSTLGDLLQRIPSISGAATNPQVNNGGGTGESNVELRGLGSDRTLVLLNGRRVGILGRLTSSVDVNLIPLHLVERVEVLKEGAGAIYGSDAIAGVVNFITKSSLDGAELTLEYGETSENDGERQSISAAWGTSTERFDLMASAEWQKQAAIFAGDREFSAFARYLSSSAERLGGSSRTPNGRIDLPDGMLAGYGGCADTGGVTRIAGASGASPDDYRCFDLETDRYNFQPVNLILTPQERASVFSSANFRLNEDLESYAEILYNRTKSSYALAPLPFDGVGDDVVISRDSHFNPFGIDFGGGDGANPNALFRLEALGSRRAETTTDSAQFRLGLRGKLPFGDWRWDLGGGYATQDQSRYTQGYLYKPAVAGAFGPSGPDAAGNIVCGLRDPVTGIVPTQNIIPNCTPVNVFNLGDESQVESLRSISANYFDDYEYRTQDFMLNLDGRVFALPAGDVQAAVGFEYREQRGAFTTDFLTRSAPPLFLTCLLSGETCTGDSSASYAVKEAYLELFVPLLKDLPAVQSLNASAGVRYSDYSTFGDTTNAQFKVEYRPISDLLVRGSYAEVFRAPTITDLSQAPLASAPTFADPCEGLTAAQVAGNPNYALACEGVPLDGSFAQPNSQIGALLLGNADLQPETGDVVTFGLVYDSSWLRNFSLTVDFWKYQLDNLIVPIDPNFAINRCVETGQSQFCDLVIRFPDGPNAGLIQQFFLPTTNLGSLQTDGVDIGLRYALPDTAIGGFRFTLDLTRIDSFESTPAPGAAPIEVVGTYDRQFGNYAQWRGLAGLGWSLASFDALLTARYIDDLELLSPDNANSTAPPLQVPSYTYYDLTAGYTWREKTRLQLGISNIADKDPPILYQNNVINANTDVSTYDTVGRRYWLSFTQKF
jgi:outer membrane receptor protein involved in Fe transport